MTTLSLSPTPSLPLPLPLFLSAPLSTHAPLPRLTGQFLPLILSSDGHKRWESKTMLVGLHVTSWSTRGCPLSQETAKVMQPRGRSVGPA